jgi:hypothetical protein
LKRKSIYLEITHNDAIIVGTEKTNEEEQSKKKGFVLPCFTSTILKNV